MIVNYDRMRILIDTNIFIISEDSNREIPFEVARFVKLATKYCDICLHALTVKDIEKDSNRKRRREMLSRVEKYYILENPPNAPLSFLKQVRCNLEDDRDIIDSNILYALKENCSTILVSNDKGMRKKARLCGISENVYGLLEAVEWLEELYEKKKIELPHIEDVPIHLLDEKDPIFKSFKSDYRKKGKLLSFMEWFRRAKAKGRRAFVSFSNNKSIAGIAIYKDETDKSDFFKGKVLKICSFKVSATSRGNKLGELLLKNIFAYAIENGYEKAFVTVLPKYSELMYLLEDFGFVPAKNIKTERGEYVLYKEFVVRPLSKAKRVTPLFFHKKYAPFFMSKKEQKKYIVPISPEYHNILFPDYKTPQREFFPKASSTSVSNSIKKAYLCKSPLKSLDVGDLIFFYRSDDLKRVTTLGIVEKVLVTDKPERIVSFVGKRTVFSYDNIIQMCEKDVLVILFRQIGHYQFNTGASYKKLLSLGISNKLVSITKISNKMFCKILGSFENECILAS